MNVTDFITKHFRHFNAATLVEAADGYARQVDDGGKMLVAMAGAMSTAEIGMSLAEMIRRDKVHAICCTGANLEEEVFNLVAHDEYRRVSNWRNLTHANEKEFEAAGLNRVTDTCIPEEQAFRAIERPVIKLWLRAQERGERFFPHEFMYQLIREGTVTDSYQIDPQNSWLVAASERNLPLFVPGWEDSTLGNIFVANVLNGSLADYQVIRSGLEYMDELVHWYAGVTMGRRLEELAEGGGTASVTERVRAVPAGEAAATVGFFQIGGGIAGDFPICVVPLIHQDLRLRCPYWSYFCQISDATTSFGGYSGAIPSEKISWGKLDVDTPTFVIESDATIVVPLIFAHVLGW